MEKCMGRRLCSKCGKNWNVADIKRAAEGGQPAIDMPPLMPPAACMGYMQTRADDREDVIRKRLDIYRVRATQWGPPGASPLPCQESPLVPLSGRAVHSICCRSLHPTPGMCKYDAQANLV